MFAHMRKVKFSQVPPPNFPVLPPSSVMTGEASQSTLISWLLRGRRIFRLHVLPCLKRQSSWEFIIWTSPLCLYRKIRVQGTLLGSVLEEETTTHLIQCSNCILILIVKNYLKTPPRQEKSPLPGYSTLLTSSTIFCYCLWNNSNTFKASDSGVVLGSFVK